MTDNNFIEIKNFNLSYGKVSIFSDFNFYVPKGRCIGIFGPTGTGKTSLLNKIVDDYIKEYKIAYIFQDNKLIENLTVKKNIMLPLESFMKKDNATETVKNIINLVNLKEKINEKASVLSGGEKQRVNIARAFAYGKSAPCEILLMDEPFSAQDEENRCNLIELTKKICKENHITSVVVSHNRNDLDMLCDNVIDL